MEETLSQLNKTSGVRGSMVVGRDGIIISSEVEEGIDQEVVAAETIALLRTSERSLSKLDSGPVIKGMISGELGKVLFVGVELGLLIALTEPEANLGLVWLELKNTLQRLNARLKEEEEWSP